MNPATLELWLEQTGNRVIGQLQLARIDVTRGGNVRAVISGSTLIFTLNIGPGGGCPTTVTGTAQVSNSSIDGTYSGSSCRGPITNGGLTLRRQ